MAGLSFPLLNAALPNAILRRTLAGCILACAALGVQAAESLVICFENADVRPWRNVNRTGLNFELLQEVANRLQVTFNYQALPWKRCLAQLKTNEVQGAFAASYRPDRLDNGAYPGTNGPDAEKRLHIDRYVFVRRRGSNVTWDGKKLSNADRPVGLQLGYSVSEQLRELNVPLDEGSQLGIELANKLLAGRISAAAMLEGEAAELLTRHPELQAKLEILPVPLKEKPYYLMLSHAFLVAKPELAVRIWKTIEEVRNSPAYRKAERKAIESTAKAVESTR